MYKSKTNTVFLSLMITLKHTVFKSSHTVIKDVSCVNVQVGTHSKLHYETRVYEVLVCTWALSYCSELDLELTV